MAKAKDVTGRQPKDFNHMKPDDIEITDPDRAAREAAGIPVDREYPKHLHKFAGPNQMHEFVEVTNAKDEAAKRREGWGSSQEADAVGRKQADATVKAPRAAKSAKGEKVAAPKAKKAKPAPKAAKAKPEPGAPAAN